MQYAIVQVVSHVALAPKDLQCLTHTDRHTLKLNTCHGPKSKINIVSLVPTPFQKEDLRMGTVWLGIELEACYGELGFAMRQEP